MRLPLLLFEPALAALLSILLVCAWEFAPPFVLAAGYVVLFVLLAHLAVRNWRDYSVQMTGKHRVQKPPAD